MPPCPALSSVAFSAFHTDEQEIKGNVEGFVENFKTKDWAKFLDSIKPEDKNATGGTTWLKFLKDQTKTQEAPFSQSFLDGLELKRIDAVLL